MTDKEQLAELTRERDDFKERYEHQYENYTRAADERDALLSALQWCGGSADFNTDGKARKGWLKICAPFLKS